MSSRRRRRRRRPGPLCRTRNSCYRPGHGWAADDHALRAHIRRSGLDSPGPVVQASLPVTVLTSVLKTGLGLPVLAWFIAIPFRYVVLDIPGRFAHMRENPLPFDPKDLWPTERPFVVLIPLWIALYIGGWTVLIGPLLLTFVAFTAVVVSPKHLGARGLRRWAWSALGTVVLLLGIWFALVARDVPVFFYAIDRGTTAALLGIVTLVAGLRLRGLSTRKRIALVLVALGGTAVFVTHHTAVGEAMLNWYLD